MTEPSIQQLQAKIRELERINRDLRSNDKILKGENTQLKDNLSKETSLWNHRQDLNIPVTEDRASLLHTLEILEGTISDEVKLHAATLQNRKEFEFILKKFENAIKRSKNVPLFRDDAKRSDDPGNRCSLYPRHALFMYLLHLKDNPTQATLEVFFGIDQSTVSRYLQFCRKMLGTILPTPRKISKEISKCKTISEVKEIIPGKGPGVLLVDGTHTPVRRPSDEEKQKETYSGKKKRHTFNTTVTSARNNIILGLGRTVVGTTHDLTLLKDDSIPFGRWAKKMYDKDTPKSEMFTTYMDLGYFGIQKDLLGTIVIMPHKRPRKKKGAKERGKLTDEQKKYNKKVSSVRVTVENSIGRIKQYARMRDPYEGTEDELNCEMNIVAGLVNLHLMMTLQRGSTSLRKRFLG